MSTFMQSLRKRRRKNFFPGARASWRLLPTAVTSMSSAPVEFFTLRLNPGEIYHLDTIRDIQITNVSYSNPEELSGKKRTVLRVHYAGNPAFDDDEELDEDDIAEALNQEEDDDEDDEDEEDDDEDEDDEEDDDEEDDDEDDEEDDEDEDDEPVFTEEDSYVVCSLIPEKVRSARAHLGG